jgi:hypothetical protein
VFMKAILSPEPALHSTQITGGFQLGAGAPA